MRSSIGSIQVRLDTEEEEAVVSSTLNQLKQQPFDDSTGKAVQESDVFVNTFLPMPEHSDEVDFTAGGRQIVGK